VYVTMLYRGDPVRLTSAAVFESLVDFVESLPDAQGRFPMTLQWEGRGAYYPRDQVPALAAELAAVEQELVHAGGQRASDFGPPLRRWRAMAQWCARAREPVLVEVACARAARQ